MTDDTNSTAGELLAFSQPAFAGALEGPTVEAIAALARDGSKPEILFIPTQGLGRGLPEKVPVLWDRHHQSVISVLDEVMAARPPLERKGTANVETLASFIDLTNRHKDAGSAIFAKTSWPNPALTAVIDYHTTDHEARFGKHRIHYAFPVTDEFKVWVGFNGKELTQHDFAEFLEEHAAELSAPDQWEINTFEPLFKERFATPAEIIDLSRFLEVNVGSKVKNAGRLKSGERQLVFETEHTNAAGEPIDIPGIFIVSVIPFLSGDNAGEKVRIPARLRYRVSGGVVFYYQLYRWEDVLRDRVQLDLAQAKTQTELPTYEGAPEMSAD